MEHAYLLPLRTECLLFFERNMYAMETLAGLSVRLGRNAEDLAPAVRSLVEMSILERVGEGDSAIYRYNAPDTSSVVVTK